MPKDSLVCTLFHWTHQHIQEGLGSLLDFIDWMCASEKVFCLLFWGVHAFFGSLCIPLVSLGCAPSFCLMSLIYSWLPIKTEKRKKKNETLLYHVLLASLPFFAWNFNFQPNLIDLEVENPKSLLSILTCVNLSSWDVQIWSISSSSLFIVKSLLLALSNQLTPIFFSSKIYMEIKSLIKGQDICFVDQ